MSIRGPVTLGSCPTAPSSSTAVATLTAPSTPMDWCTRTGMKVRVQTVPPSAGGAMSETLGMVASRTSPRPIARPASSRSRLTWSRSAASASSSATGSYPVRPRLPAATTTTGMPLFTQVTGMPWKTSRTWPVGSTPPPPFPSSVKASMIAAAVPGTPSIAVSPS